MAKKKANRNNVAQPSLPQKPQTHTPASVPTPVVSEELPKGNTEMVMFDDMLGPDLEAVKTFPADQRNVFAILKTIYGEEIRLDASRKNAWNQRILAFTINLAAFNDASIHTSIDIELPPQYPKNPPNVNVIEQEQHPVQNWRTIVQAITKQHTDTKYGDGNMISDIVQDIDQKLNDICADRERKAQGTSLEEERATTEVAAIADAKTRQQLAIRQKEADAAAREAQLAKDVETQRRRLQLLSSGNRDQDEQQGLEDEYPTDCVVFDHGIVCRDPTIDTDINFRAVRSTAVLFQKPGKKVSIACPYRNNILRPIQLVLKEVRLPDEFIGQDNFRGTLQEIETALQEVKKFDHGAIVKMYDYKLKQIRDSDLTEHWEFTVLTEFAQGGPLTNLLSMCGQMNAVRLRTYCRSILDALEYFDKKGYVHPAIHAQNILFFGSENSRYQAKLSDGYGTALRQVVEKSQNLTGHATTNSGNWTAPELIGARSTRSNKTCIWELGVVLLQMALGNDLTEKFTSPEDALARTPFDTDFDHLIATMCKTSARMRSSAFQAQSHQFLKSHEPSLIRTQARESSQMTSLARSHSIAESRWLSEWEPIGVLGKGGFGVVIKARNRMDGHFYAVKELKCKSITDLQEIWSEVRMLAQLNHPGIVRYFGAWSEDDLQDVTDTETSTAITDPRSFAPPTGSAAPPSNLFSIHSTGHDFMAPALAPVPDAEEEGDDEESESDDGNMFAYQPAPSDSGVEDSQAIASDNEDDPDPSDPFALQQYIDNKMDEEPNFFESTDDQELDKDRIPSKPEPFKPAAGPPSAIRRPHQYYNRKSTLYIQMELCQTGTLYDLIKNGLPRKIHETWRIFRHLLDGLDHIHSNGVVHRDLKPTNIFIDSQKIPKIGDFGLASPSQAIAEGHKLATHIAGPQSRGVGTLYYIPPELRTLKGPGRYSSKADMFALGVIFFEMCFALKTVAEKVKWLEAINEEGFELPDRFKEDEFKVQGRIIRSLLDHDPSKRPSAKDLLDDPEIPETLEEEKEQRWIHRLVHGDPQQFERVMNNFMSKTATRAQLLAYSDINQTEREQTDQILLNTIKDKLAEVFKAHGAVQGARETVFPVERKEPSAVTFLGDGGFALQLPYELTVPFARSIAVRMPTYTKSYCFGTVFRQRGVGVEPLCIPEADFDIISSSAKDLSLRDAQVISVLDDCLTKLGSLFVRSFSIVVSHDDLLDLVLRACLVPEAQVETVKHVLSALNVGRTMWKRVQQEFESNHIGLNSTTISALEQFDFSLNYQDMRRRVLEILTQLNREDEAVKAVRTLNRLQEIDEYLRRLRVKCPVLYSPLSNNFERLYRGSTMFKCRENKTRKVIAAGGRYDDLIRNYQTATHGTGARAVGFRMNIIEPAMYARIDAELAGQKSAKSKNIPPTNMASRVDVVITSFDEETLKTHCIEICRNVLDAGMSAELSEYYSTMDELDQAYASAPRYWLVIVKSLGTTQRSVKVRSPSREESDVSASDLIDHLKEELGERPSTSAAEPVLKRTRSSHGASERENVVILTPQHKSKKVNRAAIVDSARTAAQEKIEAMSMNCKILAIDTDDETLHRMRNTRLADAESWRALRHAVALTDREYVQEIQEQLQEWAKSGQDGGAFICNYKTKTCVFYDFGKV